MSDLSALLDDLSDEAVQRLDEACCRFEEDWRAGRRPRLGDFLAGTEGSERLALLRELLRLEVDYRRRAGEGPARAEYETCFPEATAVVEEVFALAAGPAVRRPVPETVDEPRPEAPGQAAVTVSSADTPAPPPVGPASAGDDRAEAGAVPEGLVEHPRYRLVRRLGGGGMGTVYEVEHRVMQRRVALKVIKHAYLESAGAVERFRREVRAAAQLSHPNIVTAFDAEQAGDTHFLVMEYVEGTTLGRLVGRVGPLPVAEACEYIRQAALGLQHAHERGMVHRDVKPDNLMLTPGGTVKVLDFGLASLTAEHDAGEPCQPDAITGAAGLAAERGATADEGLSRSNAIMGTADYMAPEQAADAHTADRRADIYGLGCTLYHLLTGQVPYPAATMQLSIRAHRERPVPKVRRRRPDVPEGLATVVARLLAKQPGDRYQTCGDVAAALSLFATKAPPPPPKVRRRLLIAALAALLLVGAAAVYRIQTDKGELVITTESDDVEVVVKQRGELVRVIDTKTDKSITLRSGVYELELKGAPEGLRLDVEKATLTRGEKTLARIERIPPETQDVEPPPGQADQVRQMQGHMMGLCPVAFSPDGGVILTGATSSAVEQPRPCDVQLWDAKTGKEVGRLKGQRASICSAMFSADGKRVVASGSYLDPTFRVWDVQSRKELQVFQHLTGAGYAVTVYGVAIAPDGRRVFSCGDDGTARMWDVETGKEIRRFERRQDVVRGLALSHDGRYLACGGINKDPSIRIWDVDSGKQTVEFQGHLESNGVDRGQGSLAFSPDASCVLSGGYDGTVRLWDIRAGKEVRRFEGHSGPVGGVAFSPDGQRALSGGAKDKTMRLWDVKTGKELHQFTRHKTGVQGVAFSPDGRFAVSGGGADNTARLWRLPDLPADKAKP
jgi:WD40 repeat protein/serine/threonine protein kinase